jgi:DDE superfamily endonuclease
MGPQAAKSVPGQDLVDVTQRPAQRAKQEIDYGRRGKGYVFGAFQPATGAALTWTATRRTTANFVAFLEETEHWIDPAVQRVYAILDNLSAHRAADVLLFALAHPRSRVRLPTQVRCLPESDRAVVEGPALARAQGEAV